MSLPEKSYAASPSSDKDENDVIALILTLWKERRTIIKTILIFASVGCLVALLGRKEYSATTTMIPQENNPQAQLEELSGLASMAGINLNMNAKTAIPPSVYPQIVSSVPFRLQLMKTPLNFKDIDHPVTFFEYYSEYKKPSPLSYIIKYTIGLPRIILKALKGNLKEGFADTIPNRPIHLTEEQREVQKLMDDIILIDYNEKEGYVTLSCRMPEALPSAQIAQRTQELLQEFITEFKIEKAKAKLNFVQQRYNEAQAQFKQIQKEFAQFRDRNKNVFTAMAQTELESLKNNYNIVFNIYSELANQLEQAKIQVREDTPIFTVIEPVSVPLETAKPHKSTIFIFWSVLGVLTGIGIVLSHDYFSEIKKRWNSLKTK